MTRAEQALARLCDALGPEAVLAGGPPAGDGAAPAPTLRPADPLALARAVALLHELRLAALVRGGGTRLSLGNPLRRTDVVLSTLGLEGVRDFDPGEGVCRVGAGTLLSRLRAQVNAGGWELPLDAPGRGSTVGGTLAAAAIGPRAQGFGAPRDQVLGLEVVLGDGLLTKCGGRVVKNVTGYDLAKLYTGSLGTLGVIAAAWLRLRPLPERVAWLEAAPASTETACARGLAAARRPTTRAAAVLLPAGGPARLVVELAGPAAAVDCDADGLAGEGAFGAANADALDRARRLQADPPRAGGLRFRLWLRPSRIAAVAERIAAAGGTCLLYPGLGQAWACFEPGAPASQDAAFAAVASAAALGGGGHCLEAGPAEARAGRDAFGDAAALVPLTRALKARFDPAGVLNPGRALGGT